MDIIFYVCIVLFLLVIHTIVPQYMSNNYDDKLEELDILGDPNGLGSLRTGDVIFVKNCTKCKYSNSIMNNGFQFVYRNMFNSFRWYAQGHAPYTHVGIVARLNLNGEERPYICHIDGGAPMYDVLRKKYVSNAGVVVSDWGYINSVGGMVHLYRYKGDDIEKNLLPWVMKNRDTKYPSSMYKLTMSNALQLSRNPEGTMACTDFVENTMYQLGIISSTLISGQSTINDILSIVRSSNYISKPVVLKNNCHISKHFMN